MRESGGGSKSQHRSGALGSLAWAKGQQCGRYPKSCLELKAPAITLVPGVESAGSEAAPTQPVGRSDLPWGWCRRMLPSSIMSNHLFLGAGCGYFHVWCPLSDELFLNIQPEPQAYEPWPWPLLLTFHFQEELDCIHCCSCCDWELFLTLLKPRSLSSSLGLVAPGLDAEPYQGLCICLELGIYLERSSRCDIMSGEPVCS